LHGDSIKKEFNVQRSTFNVSHLTSHVLRLTSHFVQYARCQKRQHDFVVAGYGISSSLTRGGPLYDILQRSVMLLHVEIRGREIIHVVAQILRY
jgi:hypothetical protein